MKRILISIFISLSIFIINYNQYAQKFRWAKIGGDASIQTLLTDTLNNVILFGSFSTNSINIGDLSSNAISSGNNKVFLAKFNSTGKGLWIKSIYTDDSLFNVNPIKASVNKAGNIVICANTSAKKIYIDGEKYDISNTNNYNFIVLMFHRTGKLLWLKSSNVRTNNYGSVFVKDLYFSDKNETYITGSFYGDSLILGDKFVKNSASYFQNYFSTKIDPYGVVKWLNSCEVSWTEMGSIGGEKIIANDENVFVVGYVAGEMGNVYFNKTEYLSNIEGMDIFVVSYTQNGVFRWVKKISGKYTESTPKITLDYITGNLILGSTFNSDSVRIEKLPFIKNSSSSNYDLFLTSIDGDGNFQWTRSFNVKLKEPSYLNYDLLAKNGEIFLITNFEGESLNIENNQISNVDSTNDLVLIKMDVTGSIKWFVPIHGPGYNEFTNIEIDNKGAVNFIIPISSNASYVKVINEKINNVNGMKGNLYVKINQNGNIEITKPVFYQSELNGTDFQQLSLDKFGNVYIVGRYWGLSNLDSIPVGIISGNRIPGIFISKFVYNSIIYGKVYNQQGQVVTNGIVKLFGQTRYQKAPLEDSVAIASDGSYTFQNIPIGVYFIFAKVDNNNYLPTYYPSAAHWTEAKPIFLLQQPINADIILNNSLVLSGNNSMAGQIQESDSLKINGFKSTKGIMKRPIKNATVVLISRTKKSSEYGTVVATTYTDNYGNFSFTNVPDGYYALLIDEPGLPHDSYYDIYISGGKFYGNLDYEVGLERIYTLNQQYNFVGKDFSKNLSVKIYPNPIVDNMCYIKILSNHKDEYAKIKLLSMSGQLLKDELYKINDCIINYKIDNLPSGIYILNINLNEDIINQMLIVK